MLNSTLIHHIYAFSFIVPKNEEKAYARGKATSLFVENGARKYTRT